MALVLQIKYTLILFFLLSSLSACSHLIYQPNKEHFPIPNDLGIKLQDHFFQTTDNLRLHGWFIPAVDELPVKGTILYLHGNAQNISSHLRAVWWLPHHGYNVFLFDYRGYGHSQGEPNLEGLHQDVNSAVDYVFNKLPINKNNIIVYGQSLGGALAITATPRSKYFSQVRGVIIEGTFTNYRRVAREALSEWWLSWAFQIPLSYTVTDNFRAIDAISSLSPTPLLIIHGADDNVIHPQHSKDLFRAAKQPKQLWIIENGGHNNALEGNTARKEFLQYLQTLLQNPATR